MKKYYIILCWLIVHCSAVFAQDEIDTIPEYYHHYLYQWVDDSAAVCYHDSTTCWRFNIPLGYSGGTVSSDHNNGDLASFHYFGKELAAKYEVADSVIIIGLAMATNLTLERWNLQFTTGELDFDDSVCNELRLYKPSSTNMQLLRSGLTCVNDYTKYMKFRTN